MVTKSFGKRNFMQPMGRPKHALKVPCFFSFYVLEGEGGGDIFLSFFLTFQCVCTLFPSSSQWVPNMFLNFAMFSPTCSPYHLTFIPYALGNGVLLSPYISSPKGRNYILQNIAFCLGESP
jgi:hypothetical protein